MGGMPCGNAMGAVTGVAGRIVIDSHTGQKALPSVAATTSTSARVNTAQANVPLTYLGDGEGLGRGDGGLCHRWVLCLELGRVKVGQVGFVDASGDEEWFARGRRGVGGGELCKLAQRPVRDCVVCDPRIRDRCEVVVAGKV